VLDSTWAMQRKRKIGIGEVSKYKTWLNAHRGQKAIKELANVFEITDEGAIDQYLGVKIKRRDDGSIKMYSGT